MPDDRTGTSAGDPAASIRLLWRARLAQPAARPGPRPTLSVDRLVEAAIELADAEGMTALTMRRLAERLATKPMSLYRYVPGRAELVDLMLDRVYEGMPRTPYGGADWRARVRALADANRALYLAHPWAAELSTLRPPLGPGQLAKYEHELGAFAGSGLSDLEIDDALTLVLSFVRANAADALAAERSRAASGLDDRGWWAVAGPILSELVTDDAYPLASRIGSAAGEARGSAHDPEHAYEFGLEVILSSLGAWAAGASDAG